MDFFFLQTMAYCMVCKSLLLYASIAVEASPGVALFYLMYVSSMLRWRHSMQYFVTFLFVQAGSCNN
jgi:hypothetical protein